MLGEKTGENRCYPKMNRKKKMHYKKEKSSTLHQNFPEWFKDHLHQNYMGCSFTLKIPELHTGLPGSASLSGNINFRRSPGDSYTRGSLRTVALDLFYKQTS